jgi:hypothetical protein
LILIAANNKIKLMNGETFGNLHNLREVRLLGNECVDHDFEDKGAVQVLSKSAPEGCTYCEHLTNCEMKEELSKLFSELSNKQKDENQQIKFELASLKKVLMDFLKRDGISDSTFDDKLNYELKFNENAKLREDLLKLQNEVENKNKEIEKLKNKFGF